MISNLCNVYYMFLVCINWYTYSCAKTFTPLRKTFFDSNVSLIHVNCLICKSNLLYIDICLYICSLYPVQYYLSNKIMKRKKFSSLYEPNLLGQGLLFSVVNIISKVINILWRWDIWHLKFFKIWGYLEKTYISDWVMWSLDLESCASKFHENYIIN